MPELIAEMAKDLTEPENSTVREFFVAPSARVTINSRQTRLIYYEDQHSDLMGKVAILENEGFVTDVTTGTIPIYRMTEDFVAYLKG